MCERRQCVDLSALTNHATQPLLLASELLHDHTAGMLALSIDVSIARSDKILMPPIRIIC
jgi:transcriptional regulator of met regulon